MTPANIGNIGERHVTYWLTMKGYECNRNTQLPGCTDIEAIGPDSRLVQVKTAVSPNVPAFLDPDDRSAIVGRANIKGFYAYLARVMISETGNMIGAIDWTELN